MTDKKQNPITRAELRGNRPGKLRGNDDGEMRKMKEYPNLCESEEYPDACKGLPNPGIDGMEGVYQKQGKD